MPIIPLLGYEDDAELLGWLDDVPLGSWEDVSLPGDIDPVGGPLGGPVSERVYTISALLYFDWSDQTPGDASDSGAIAASAIAGGAIAGGSGEEGEEDPVVPPYTLQAASADFTTLVDDPDLPSVWWDGRILEPGDIDRSLSLVPVDEAAIETSVGRVVIDNTDGLYDTSLDVSSAVSQSVEIKGGVRGQFMNTFETLFVGRISGVGMSERELTLELRDPVLYAQNLYPTTVWTGSGGAGGDSELNGVVKPVVLGKAWNVSPVLQNSSSLIYAVNDGAMTAVDGVFDGGVALTFDANYSNYTTLAAATVPAGNYATSLASGLIRLGSTPSFAITAHVRGNSSAGTTVEDIGTYLANQIATLLDMTIDTDSFADLPAWDAGWVWNDTFTLADALSRFAGDGGFHWGSDVNGVLRAVQLLPPVAGESVATYREEDILAIERAPLPAGYEGVHHRRIIRYRRNWTVQDDASLAGAAVERAGRQREWKTATSTVSTTSRNAIDPPVLETSLEDAADAESLADHLLALHGEARRMFSVVASIHVARPPLGSTVILVHPRFGLSDGMPFRVISAGPRLGTSTINLLLWG